MEGDGERKRLVMQADGALEQKLAALVAINSKYAEEFGKQKWVPEIQMGTSGNGSGSSATDLINLLTAKTAKEISLDMTVPGGN